jgi:hypothetical protein
MMLVLKVASISSPSRPPYIKGLFVLKPLKRSRNRKKFTVQFFWQVPVNYDIGSQIDLLTEPTSSEGLEVVGDG